MSNPTNPQALSAATLTDEPSHYAPEFLEIVIRVLRETVTHEVRKAFGKNSPQSAMLDSLEWLDYVSRNGSDAEEVDSTHKALMCGVNAATQCGAVWTDGMINSVQRGK